MSSEFCHLKAQEILERLGITEPPVDVEAIAKDHGLSVRRVIRSNSFSGQLVRERMRIEVNQKHARQRQRFTIAHELGHFVLSHSPAVSVFDDRTITDPSSTNERQANAFAAGLLMPEGLVRDWWIKLRNIEKMANRFDVSSEAMYYRLDGLDLLGLPPVR